MLWYDKSMVRLLPFILVPVLVILAGLGYWRYIASQQTFADPREALEITQSQAPVEVPKTLPAASLEQRVQSLEDSLTKLSSQTTSPKPGSSQSLSSNALETRVAVAESALTDLKARVSALEKTTPTSSGTNYPLYIPLGSGGGPWGDQGWIALNEYQVSINPDKYPNYSGMQLEVNFRLAEAAGTGSVRLYNITDSSAITSQVDTSSTTFSTQTSSSFKLPSGQKTYTIQVKTSEGKNLSVQSARIKVNF